MTVRFASVAAHLARIAVDFGGVIPRSILGFRPSTCTDGLSCPRGSCHRRHGRSGLIPDAMTTIFTITTVARIANTKTIFEGSFFTSAVINTVVAHAVLPPEHCRCRLVSFSRAQRRRSQYGRRAIFPVLPITEVGKRGTTQGWKRRVARVPASAWCGVRSRCCRLFRCSLWHDVLLALRGMSEEQTRLSRQETISKFGPSSIHCLDVVE